MTATQDSLETSLDTLLDAPAPTDGGAGGGDGGGDGGGERGGSHSADAGAPADDRRRMKIIIAILAVLLLLIAAIFAWYLINRKPLTQLPGVGQEVMPHYSMSIYQVSAPIDVAVTPDGSRIYVTQTDGPRVVAMFDAQGNSVGTFTPPRVKGKGHIPVYLAINPQTGQVWVTDRLTQAIYVYSANGAYIRTFTSKTIPAGWQPMGVAFDKVGNLYVTDVSTAEHRLLVFDPTGKLTRTITAKDPMSFPNGVAVDAQGRIAVADSNRGRMLVFNQDGKLLQSVNRGVGNGNLGLPRGVTFDSDGRLYVVDTTNQAINVYRLKDDASSVDFVGTFGDQGIGDGMFQYPNGIATDDHGRVYVTDRANDRLQVWSF